MLSQSTIKLCRLANQLAARFEKLGIDESGAMDASDRKLMEAVRQQAEKVLSEPLRKLARGNGQ